MPERLLRRVVEQPAHLLGAQTGRASRSRGRAEIPGECVRADVCRRLKCSGAHGHGDARADVVAERHGAQEVRAVDAELFAGRESGRHDGRTGMRLRGRMRIVGFIGMRQHPIGEGGFDGAAHCGGRSYRRHFVAGVFQSEADRKAPGREFGAGDHGGERIQDVLFGSLGGLLRQ